jgi:8-oxo-dGTP diphosphatase
MQSPGHSAEQGPPAFGASAVILRGNAVLLVRRGKAPLAGLWSLPGGRIEPGETAAETAAREVREETGLAARVDGFLQLYDVVVDASTGDADAVYRLAVYYGRAEAGEPVAAGDASEARFVPLGDLGRYTLTIDADRLIAAAAARYGE